MSQKAFLITEVDAGVLRALAHFHYLTAAQASRLLYPNNKGDNNRYMQRLFKRLVDAGYVLRLRALPMPRYGQAPHVFTLARKGRAYLQSLGVAVEPYFRPSEERRATENSPFMAHRLGAIDVMIAAELLCRAIPSITCPRNLSERELKRGAVHVDVRSTDGTRRVAVIPDAWFQLKVDARNPYSIAIELDRGTEDQKVWRSKIAAYAAWSMGPYQEAFETDNLTVAVVCPDGTRVAQLREWTLRELALRELTEYSELFLFTAVAPDTTPPRRFFFDPLWQQPHHDVAVRLIAKEPLAAESGVVFQTV
jgi:hypothetical protein